MSKSRLKALLCGILMIGTFAGFSQSPALLKDISTYDLGIELFRKEQYGNAQQKFDLYLKEHKEAGASELKTSAQYYGALCAIKLYNKDAKQRVEEFGAMHELSLQRNNLFFEYANYRFSTKRYKEAHEYYAQVDQFRISEEPLNELLFKDAYSLLMKKEAKEAKRIFFKLKDKDTKYSNSARYYYAHLLYVDSNYAEALTNFLPLENSQDFGPIVPYYLAQIYYRLKDFDKLVEVGEDLINKASEKRAPEIAKLLADAFYKREDFENSTRYLTLYKEKGGKMRLSDHFQLGYSYYRLNNYPEAIQSFNKISNGNMSLKQNSFYHLGDCYLKTDQKKKAITAFKAASEMDFSESIQEDAYFNYAKLVYEFADPYQDAITTLNKFIRKYPESKHKVEINRYLANLYLTTKDYERALVALKKVGLETPEMQEIYQKISFYRATEVFNSLRYVEAIAKYKESLKYPVNIRIAGLSQFWIGEAYYRLKKYDEAIQSINIFRKRPGVISLDEYSRSFYQSAYCHYKKFNFQKSAADYRTFTRDASKNDPRMPDAYLRLADCYFLTGGYIKASSFYASAIKYETKEKDYAYYQRAECLGLIGKRGEKITELEKLIKKFPNSDYAEDAQFEVAETYLRIENYNKALASFRDFIAFYPASGEIVTAHMRIGLIYSNTDQNELALNKFKFVVSDYAGTDQSIEAVGLARLVYTRINRINDYIDWVDGLNFVNFEKSTLDSTAYEVALDLYSEGDCEQALKAFSSYLNRFDKGLFVLKSNFYTSQCAVKMGDEELELKSLLNISKMPLNEYSVRAETRLAQNAFQENDYTNSLERYKKLASISEDKTQELRAKAGMMRSAYKLGDYKNAAIYAEAVNLINVDLPELKVEAGDIVATSYYKMGEFPKAFEKYQGLASIAAGELKAKSLFYISDILNKQEQYDSSTTMIYTLIEELPAYKEYKMKALILLAKNFWKKGDVFQANYTLDFVVKSNFNSSTVKEAELLKEEIKLYEENIELEKAQQLKSKNDSIKLDIGDGTLFLFEESDSIEDIEELEEWIEEPVDTNQRKK